MPAVVNLRAVEPDDLPVFFDHQRDPEAVRMAAFTSRAQDAFTAHWKKILADPACATRTIVHGGQVAGTIGAWTDASSQERMVGYWIGRDRWGRGIASAALAQFLTIERTRPLVARVAKHNPASLRVLQKCGFKSEGQDRFTGSGGMTIEEFILALRE